MMELLYTEARLKKYISNNRLELCFIPQVSAADEMLVGAQAVLTAKSKKAGQQIQILSLYLLEQVCRCLEEWKEKQKQPGIIFMKVSASVMERADIVEKTNDIFKKYPHTESMVCFQICETAEVKNWPQFYENCRQLKQQGIHLALDALGSEDTEQGLMQEDYFDEIKIDTLLTDYMLNRTMDYLRVLVITDVSHRNGQLVSADNVTDQKQYKLLKKLGCDRVQGTFIDSVKTVKEFEEQYLDLDFRQVV